MKLSTKKSATTRGRFDVLGLPEAFAASIVETTSWQQQLGSKPSWSYRATVWGRGGIRRSDRPFSSKAEALRWVAETAEAIETKHFRASARRFFRKAA